MTPGGDSVSTECLSRVAHSAPVVEPWPIVRPFKFGINAPMQTDQIDNPPTRPAKAPAVTPYLLGWAVLGLIAVAYLGIMAFRPDVLARQWPAAPDLGSPQSNQGQRADVVAEVRSLKATVNAMQQDMAEMKAGLTAQSSLAQSWETRIAALEPKTDAPHETSRTAAALKTVPKAAVKQAAAPVAAAPVAKIQAPAAVAAAPQPVLSAIEAAAASGGDLPISAAPGVVVAPSATPPTAPGQSALPNVKSVGGQSAELKVINAPASEAVAPAAAAPPAAGLVTGSVGTPAAKAPVAAAQPAKPSGIIIGNGSSLDSLRLSWSLLSDRHATTIGKLEPRYTTGVDANGLTYDLVAGPVKSAAEAKKLCKDLVAKAIPCRVSSFGGEAL